MSSHSASTLPSLFPLFLYVWMCVCFSFVTPWGFWHLLSCLPPSSRLWFSFLCLGPVYVGVSHLQLSCMSDLLLFTPPGKPSESGGILVVFRDRSGDIWPHVCLFIHTCFLYRHVFIYAVYVYASHEDSLEVQCQTGCSLPSGNLNMEWKQTAFEPIADCSILHGDGLHVKYLVDRLLCVYCLKTKLRWW